MKILYLRPSSSQADPHVESIKEWKEFTHNKSVVIFDYFVEDQHSEILRLAHEFRPQIVVWLGTCGGPYQTGKETFRALRRLGGKVICLCPEASHPDWEAFLNEYRDFDLVVNLDGNDSWNSFGVKKYTTLAIYGQAIFEKVAKLKLPKVINVGFCGGSGSPGTMREQVVTHLRRSRGHNNIGLLTEFAFIENPGTYFLYASFMSMCKIAINMAGSSEDRSLHVKGRVIEAGLARCTLLEQAGSPIGKWLPSDCYFTYNDPYDAEKMIHYLLENPELIQKASHRLHYEVVGLYNPVTMWDEIFWLVRD